MAEAGVNPTMLRWARERAGLSVGELQARIKKPWAAALFEWEQGHGGPSFEQARTLSSILRAPLGYLFLERAPVDEIDVPDLRTVGNERRPMSLDLLDTVMDAQRKQAWLRDHREEHGAPRVALVGGSKTTDPPVTIAVRIAEALGLTASERAKSHTWEDHLRALVERAEHAGVLVLRSGMVGSNTRRLLDVHEFRGFALVDELAPVVFINTQDVAPAQIFTLVHELAHLALAVEGVSNAPVAEQDALPLRMEEELCNRVAAEVLLPGEEFVALWDPRVGLPENAQGLARHFKVSQLVVARRAFDDGRVTAREYWPFVKKRMAAARAKKEKQKEGDGRPVFSTMVKLRNGRAFIDTVVRAVHAGELLYRDAARLLGVKPAKIDELGV